MSQAPHLDLETELRSKGYELIAGVDEVGRGALAGPVLAAAVIVPIAPGRPWYALVRDSKQLSARQRDSLSDLINGEAVAIGLGIVSNEVIDSVNILQATRLAMIQAVEQLPRRPDFLLIDRLGLSQCPIPQKGITGGDRCCLSIACASIVAKTARDRLMEQMDVDYPGYGFARHKGYGTAMHLASLRELGPSPVHRKYFAPVMRVLKGRSHRAPSYVGPGFLPGCQPEGKAQQAGFINDRCPH
ncbi:MAG: ribonuclease HII [Dehalococcoidia bacterium]